jgi:hypothetical protein
MQIPCVYIPGPAPAVSVANSDDKIQIHWLYLFYQETVFILI